MIISNGVKKHVIRPVTSGERKRGATIVEFALITPILLAMILGIIEFAWLAKNHLTVANSAREGARAASLGRTTNEITARINSVGTTLPGINASPSRLTIQLHKDDNPNDGYSYNTVLGNSGTRNNAASGGMIRVRLIYQNMSLTNFFPFTNRTMTISVIMRREA